jgi:hypothetical protein
MTTQDNQAQSPDTTEESEKNKTPAGEGSGKQTNEARPEESSGGGQEDERTGEGTGARAGEYS